MSTHVALNTPVPVAVPAGAGATLGAPTGDEAGVTDDATVASCTGTELPLATGEATTTDVGTMVATMMDVWAGQLDTPAGQLVIVATLVE